MKARNSGRAFILCRSTLRLSEIPSKPDRPSPSSSETPQSGNVLVGQAPSLARLKLPPLIAADASSQPLAIGVDLCEGQAASFALSNDLVLCAHSGTQRRRRSASEKFVNLRGPA